VRKGGFGIWFVLAVLFGLGAAFLVVTAMGAARQTEKVVVAAREILPERQVTSADLKVEDVPRAAVPQDAVRSPEQATGKWTRGLVLPGEVLRRGHLAEDSGVRGVMGAKLAAAGDPKIRAFAIPAESQTTVGGEVREGDRVDLLGVVNVSAQGQQLLLSKVLAAGVAVLKVAGESSDPLKPSSGGALVLAVSPELAEDLAYVLNAGKLYVLLNPYQADESAAKTAGVVPETFLKKYGYQVAPAPGR